MSAVLVFDCIDGDRLEAAPADGEGEGIAGLQHFGEPPVALQAELHVAPALLHSRETTHQQRLLGSEVPDKLVRDACSKVLILDGDTLVKVTLSWRSGVQCMKELCNKFKF